MNLKKHATIVVIAAALYLLFMLPGCGSRQNHDHEAAGHQHTGEEQAAGQHVHEEPGVQHEHEGEESSSGEVIMLDPETMKIIDLKTVFAERADFDEVVKAAGKIINNQNREVHMSTLIPGRVHMLMADWGETVRKGQGLACLESIEIGMKRAEYDKARAEFELAEADFRRKENLLREQAVSEKVFLEAETNRKSAEINLEYAKKMLLLSGLKEEEIAAPPDDHRTVEGCSFHLTAPIDGVIIGRSVVTGEQVNPGDCLFRILDNSTVWIEVNVYEKDLQHLKKDGVIKLSVPAYPDRVFTGRIFYIGSTIDEATRTVIVRSEVPNKDFALKPGMFAEVDIVTGSRSNVLAVPAAALLSEDNLNFVFSKHGDHFHRHQVTTGSRGDGLVEILSGIEEGEEIVVRGHYQLKSKMLMSGMDPHAGHIHD